MKYPFADAATVFEGNRKTFSELAKTEHPFDEDFPNRLPACNAYDFDLVTRRVCAYRSLKEKRLLCSADALVILSSEQSTEDGNDKTLYCFIEFKNQKVDNIQSLKDSDDNTLQVKAFDSLSVCAMTFARNVSMAELQQKSIFVVVYPRQNYSERFLASLGELSAENGTMRPLWKLDKLQDAGFFRKVYTVSDEEFNRLSILNVG